MLQQLNPQPQLITGGKSADPSFTDPLLPHLLEAMNRAVEIDMTVSFVLQSGLMLLKDAIEDALDRGCVIRLITSDYLDVTEPTALRSLMHFVERNADVRIYESQGNPGFHMKSYLFIREQSAHVVSGSLFVGSSNISRAALTQSLEWNLRQSFDDQLLDEFAMIREPFDKLLDDPRVKPLTHAWIDQYIQRYHKSPFRQVHATEYEEVTDKPVPSHTQELALAALFQSRQQGFRRGLVVLATGLGKTWLSAFDVRQFNAKKVLFIAHREEILLQAQQTFQRLNPEVSSALFTGQTQIWSDWMFASIQTISKSRTLQSFLPEHFDYIIVDEFHHATAPTYRRVIDYFQPKFLLGLTATPERTDQADLLALCDDNLVFEKTLRDAIRDKELVPFAYFGIKDEFINYEEIPWRHGQFEPAALNNAFASHQRAQHALKHWREKKQTRTLSFCISRKHAEFMANCFNVAGYRAVAVYQGSMVRRNEALKQLDLGQIDIIFSVDLFNEGTDLPRIDTLLMLRPTDSKIVFLQQLGRGLRLAEGKQSLVVIDLVGNHRACLNKPQILLESLTGSASAGSKQLNELPEGCYINLDPDLLPILDRFHSRLRVVDQYRALKEKLGFRPSAVQAYADGIDFSKVRKQAHSWFDLVRSESDISASEAEMMAPYTDFLLKGVESTTMTKSFKVILLQAFLELDGFRQSPTLEQLAAQSFMILQRHPDVFRQDVPEKFRDENGQSPAWLKYWKANPIQFSTKNGKDNPEEYWFVVEHDTFKPAFDIQAGHVDRLHQWVQELIDLRLMAYLDRK